MHAIAAGMSQSDFDRAKKYSVMLRRMLDKKPTEAFEGMTFLFPEDTPREGDGTSTYVQMCEKLDVRPRPLLVVVKDGQQLHQLTGMHHMAEGAYHPLAHTIVMKQSNMLEIEEGKPFATYVVAHEVSHATGHPTRRNILQNAAAASVGAAAGISTYNWMKPELRSGEEESCPRWLGRVFVGGLAYRYVGAVVSSYLNRHEEFYADVMARKAVDGDWSHQIALAEAVIDKAERTSSPHFVNQFRMQIAQNCDSFASTITRLEEQGLEQKDVMNLLLADFLATVSCRSYNLGHALLVASYPTIGERFMKADWKEQATQGR